jgi:hypothetical protein
MLVIPNAKEVPHMTATIADERARIKVFTVASTNKGLPKALLYQSSVKPSIGRLNLGETVNENNTVTITGAKRYESTTPTKIAGPSFRSDRLILLVRN